MVHGTTNSSIAHTWPRIVGAGCGYFALVFGAGFVLGSLRVLVVVPALGERLAELGETPLMLLVVFFAARWIVQRFRIASRCARIYVGLTGLGLLLLAEWGVVLFVRNESIGEYVAGRDPVAATVYLASLVLFAAMPALIRPVDGAAGANPRRRD